MELTQTQNEQIKGLLCQMTLEEKIGQLNLASVSLVGGFEVPFEELIEMVTDGRITKEEFNAMIATASQDYHEEEIRSGKIGAFMVKEGDKANELQKIAVEESRLGIPLLFGFDVIHGFETVYPIAIAEAGTFEPELFKKTAQMAAKESRAQGVNWHFAPMVDVARDARWGRVSEGPGEDVYLGSVFCASKIKGLQEDRSSTKNYVAACMKHYVAYGACEGGRDYNTTSMALSQLYNTYLPPFYAGVKAKAASVMASFNDINGIPATLNQLTLRTILKESYGFEGFVVSDANGIRECVNHGIVANEREAGISSLLAGLDMDMGTGIYESYLKEAVEKGEIPLEALDEAVERVLKIKMWLGLFEHPYVDKEEMNKYATLPIEHRELAREAAEKSIVVLKNEGNLLPLPKDKKIGLMGGLAADKDEMAGAWAMAYRKEDCVTILDGFSKQAKEVKHFPCCTPESSLNEKEVNDGIAFAEVLVAVVGETARMSGEASSMAEITLSGEQRRFIQLLLDSGKPVIVLLMNGRPLALDWEAKHLPVLVECWHLGTEMGNAVANIVFGDKNPEGRLSASFPKFSGQCPVYYSHTNTGRPGSKSKFTSRYLDAGFEPLYPFGFGLSYTTFTYSSIELKELEEKILATVTITNEGERAGIETVQLYMQDVTAKIVRPVKELKNFTKVSLKAKESKEVTLELWKSQMGYFNDQGKYQLENGIFRIGLGTNAKECEMKEIQIVFSEKQC